MWAAALEELAVGRNGWTLHLPTESEVGSAGWDLSTMRLRADRRAALCLLSSAAAAGLRAVSGKT